MLSRKHAFGGGDFLDAAADDLPGSARTAPSNDDNGKAPPRMCSSRLSNHAEFIPNSRIPPFIPIVQIETSLSIQGLDSFSLSWLFPGE